MPNDSKTYIVNDQPTETDALDFTPYVETLADIIQTGNTPLTSSCPRNGWSRVRV
jgi:hypothetical protein